MWKENGYEVEKAVPLDMFPGTVNLEILILLKPVSKRS
jgi:tRNA/tmRNA/rRNA uracil-C5-methylase (TrmA/RlmC/RlmD family)